MKYRLRRDVLLENVAGINVLIALRTAWDECPFGLQISPQTAFLWNCFKDEMSEKDILQTLISTYHYEPEIAEKRYQYFIKDAMKHHYLSPLEETS